MTHIEDVKKHIAAKKAVLGTKVVMKGIKQGKISKVYISSNCPGTIIKELNHYSKLSAFELIHLEIPNDELGVICKKPFSVSLLGVLK